MVDAVLAVRELGEQLDCSFPRLVELGVARLRRCPRERLGASWLGEGFKGLDAREPDVRIINFERAHYAVLGGWMVDRSSAATAPMRQIEIDGDAIALDQPVDAPRRAAPGGDIALGLASVAASNAAVAVFWSLTVPAWARRPMIRR